MRQLVTESLILTVLGGGVGLVVAFPMTTSSSRLRGMQLGCMVTPRQAPTRAKRVVGSDIAVAAESPHRYRRRRVGPS
jgi:hypothetical protein